MVDSLATQQPNDDDAAPRVHDSAIVADSAVLEPGVVIGPWAIVEAHAVVGRGSVIGPRAYVGPHTILAPHNRLYIGAIVGHDAQDKRYTGEPTCLRVGEGCTFRENSVIHRGSKQGSETVIGARGYFMHQAHVGHDGKIGDDVVIGPNCLLAGHVTVHDGATLSGNTAVHQHCRVGRLAFIRGQSAISMDLPPFCISDMLNRLRGLNVVGLRRSGVGREDRFAVQAAFKRIFWGRRPINQTCEELEAEAASNGHSLSPLVAELITFIREAKRGVVRMRDPHTADVDTAVQD